MIAAIDYESEYDKKGLSASTVGVHNYARRTNVYLVSIVTDDGFEWVGHPSEAPWEKVLGHTWISHNRSFDMTVHRALKFPEPEHWHCTADMASYCQLPRALAKAIAAVYGEVVDKSIRDSMDGVKWADVPEAEKEAVRQYALKDGRACLRLWQDFESKWPENERWLSRHTTEMGHRGIGLDVPLLHAGIEILQQKLHQIRKDIPWEGPPTSPKELARACRDAGLEPPVTTSVKDSRYDAWLKANEEMVPWVRSLGLYRSTNRLLSGLETMDAFRDGDRLYQPLLYCGAPHTGRWSGGTGEEGSGFNLQNLGRSPLWGVDQRAMLIAKDGYVFGNADLTAIEPRVLGWLTGNKSVLQMLASGMDVYEIHARAYKGFTGSVPLKIANPELRKAIKPERIGLDYGLGPRGFRKSAASIGVHYTAEESEQIVYNYREKNPGVTGLWGRFDEMIRSAGGEPIEVVYPSGRKVTYRDVRWNPEIGDYGKPIGWQARFLLGGPFHSVRGPKLVENLTQGVSREVFAHCLRRVEEAGLPVVHHVHDEATVEIEDKDAEDAKQEMIRIMSTAPDWMPGLPLASEAKLFKRYEK